MNFLKNKIALGTVQFGLDYGISNPNGQTPIEEVIKTIKVARENGIDTIDSAFAYGESENVLGLIDTTGFKLITKFIGISNKKDLDLQLAESLSKLNRNSIYGYIAHRPNEILKKRELWQFINEKKHENIIQKIGFSFNTIEEVKAVLEADLIPDLIQVPFNILDNRFEMYMKELKDKYGTEIHTRSTFLQGLFFMDIKKLDPYFNGIKEWLKENQDENLPGKLLKYVADKEYIDKVVIGVNNHSQLFDNINALRNVSSTLKAVDFQFNNNILTPSNWPIN